MNKDEYIKAHIAKNPKLANDDEVVSLKASSLKRLLGEAHQKGVDHAQEIFKKFNDITKRFSDIAGKR